MDTTTNQHDEGDAPAGDFLVGRDAIHPFLVELGMPPETDIYYLKRSGWPIGNTSRDRGGKLIASKRRLIRHLEKLTRGSSAA
jgi:hypothetical protein